MKSEILKDYTFPPSDPDKTLVEDSIWFSNQLRKKGRKNSIESVTLFPSLWVISCEYEMKGDLENNPELGRFYENHDLWQDSQDTLILK